MDPARATPFDRDAAIAQQIERLRTEFDQRFAAPPAGIEDARLPLLLVRVGELRHCLPLNGLISFTACSRLTMLPGQHAACLGIAGHRGRAIPVYSLAVLLDVGVGDNAPRWLAVTQDGIGIGITGFDGQIQARPSDVRAREGKPHERFLHLDTLVHADRVLADRVLADRVLADRVYPVIDLPTLLTPFTGRMRSVPTAKE